MLLNFEHNNFTYKTIENAVHVSCHERLLRAEMLPIFKYNGLAYVSIENAVVRNAHDEQKPSQNVSTMTCIKTHAFEMQFICPVRNAYKY